MTKLTTCDNIHCKYNRQYACTSTMSIQLDENGICVTVLYDDIDEKPVPRPEKLEKTPSDFISKPDGDWLKFI